MEQERDSEQLDEIGNLCYMERIRKGTPPPLAERQEPSTPINFRAIKVGKSHLALIGKNFGKNLWENVLGKRKAPNLVERGQETLKYERIKFGAKIVELFGNASG